MFAVKNKVNRIILFCISGRFGQFIIYKKELWKNNTFWILLLIGNSFFEMATFLLEKLRDFILTALIFVTTKFDGSNIGKDEEGVIYSRRLILPSGEKQFLKTDLKMVKEANIERFKNILLESLGLSGYVSATFVIYPGIPKQSLCKSNLVENIWKNSTINIISLSFIFRRGEGKSQEMCCFWGVYL